MFKFWDLISSTILNFFFLPFKFYSVLLHAAPME